MVTYRENIIVSENSRREANEKRAKGQVMSVEEICRGNGQRKTEIELFERIKLDCETSVCYIISWCYYTRLMIWTDGAAGYGSFRLKMI